MGCHFDHQKISEMQICWNSLTQANNKLRELSQSWKDKPPQLPPNSQPDFHQGAKAQQSQAALATLETKFHEVKRSSLIIGDQPSASLWQKTQKKGICICILGAKDYTMQRTIVIKSEALSRLGTWNFGFHQKPRPNPPKIWYPNVCSGIQRLKGSPLGILSQM